MKTQQINSDVVYQDIGSKAGKASRQKDYTMMRWHCDWLKRVIATEPENVRQHVREVFNEAYRQASGAMLTPTYFR